MTPDPLTPSPDSPTPLCDAEKVDAGFIIASHSDREFIPLELGEHLERELAALGKEREELRTPDSPTPRVDSELRRIELAEDDYEDRHDCYCALAKFARHLERENAALRDALEALYHYEARRSSPDTAWEQPMMRNARKALGL